MPSRTKLETARVFLRFAVLSPIGVPLGLLYRFWEWWHYHPSQAILMTLESVMRVLSAFVYWQGLDDA